ncbi:diguanylate cyclase domain-containing protein [Spiribacter halobius]|uniref:diguanylate cyclase domain-containing protein n=1 Tax=Sediminicurvatus halobius TaxID=2182432 RepID=UPI001304F808|nr:diguanylate cyclase [Spiribacter halobius]UEX79414.1 diguanylate cyclase [Spiribacter halobius]
MITLGLCLLSAAGMAIRIPVFFGVEFLFGSVAVMLAVPVVGAGALVVALAGGLATLPLWGHPYALLSLLAEAGVVTLLYRRGWHSVLMSDLVFWIAVGVPLVLVCYRGLLGMPWDATTLLALKQPLNGLFNALLAGLSLLAVELWRRPHVRRFMGPTQLQAVLFHVLVLLTLAAASLPTLYQGSRIRSQEETALAARLRDRAQEVAAHVATREVAGEKEWLRLLAEARLRPDIGLAVLDGEGRVLAADGPVMELARMPVAARGTVPGLLHWAPVGVTNPMQRWKAGRYRATVPVRGNGPANSVVSEQAAAAVVQRVQREGIRLFGMLAGVFALATLLARPLSRLLTQPIARLSRVASNSTNGVIITDPLGRTEWVNDGFTRLTGYPLEAMLGRKPGEVLCGSDSDRNTGARMAAAVAEGRGFEAELVNYRRDGASYWVHINCSPLHNERGALEGFIAIETDVTQRKAFEDELRQERERFANIIWGTGAGTWEWNVQTGEVRLNERWASIIGYTLEELAPISIDTWIRHTHPEDLARSEDALQRHFAGETDAYESEVRMRHRDGHWVWILDRGRLISRTDDGRPQWIFGTHLEITARKEAQLQVDELLARLQQMVAKVPGVVYQYRQWPDGRFAFPYVSEGVRELYGLTPRDIIEEPSRAFELIHPEDRERVAAGIQASFEQVMPWNEQYRALLPDGRTLWLEGHADPERMADGSVLWHGYIRDVTAFKETERHLHHIAHYDSLTGLPNRALLADRLERERALARRQGSLVAVVYLDLNGFKPVNDTYGHATGDALLRELADVMRRNLRETDTAARVGGDEFVVLLGNLADQAAALESLERLLAALAEPLAVDGLSLRVTASAGVSFYPQPEPVDGETLIHQADQAMYQAKHTGRGGYRVYRPPGGDAGTAPW